MSTRKKRLLLSIVISVLMVTAIIPFFCKHVLKLVPTDEEIAKLSEVADYMVATDMGMNVYDYWDISAILDDDSKKDESWARRYKFATSYDIVEKDDVTKAKHSSINIYCYSSNFFGAYRFKYPITHTAGDVDTVELNMKTSKKIDFRWYEYIIYVLIGIPVVYGLISFAGDSKKK